MSDAGKYKKDFALSRHHQRAHEEKQHSKNMQSVSSERAHLSNSDSRYSLSRLKGKANFSSHSSQHILASDKRDSKDSRNFSNHHQNDSIFSDRNHYSSANVVHNRFRDSVNGLQHTSRRHKSPHRRSISADSRSKAKVKDDFNSPVFRENLSNSALKERMEKKLRWINSLPQNACQQHNWVETRGPTKTAVPRKPFNSSTAKHNRKTPLSAQDGTFSYFTVFYRLLAYTFCHIS